MRTWQDNADEFGEIERGEGGWSLAVLVACSVDPNVPPGRPAAKGNALPFGKVTATEFATRARVSRPTVQNYLAGWTAAIEAGADVPPLADLSPADVGSFPLPDRPFNGRKGFASTAIPGGNGSNEHLTRRIATGSALAGAVASSPEAIAAVLGKAEPEVIEKALGKLPAGKVRTVTNKSLETESRNREREHGPAPQPTPHPLDGLIARTAAWKDVERALRSAREAIEGFMLDFGEPDEGEQAHVRMMAVGLLDTMTGTADPNWRAARATSAES